jgi:hypothetical protein
VQADHLDAVVAGVKLAGLFAHLVVHAAPGQHVCAQAHVATVLATLGLSPCSQVVQRTIHFNGTHSSNCLANQSLNVIPNNSKI